MSAGKPHRGAWLCYLNGIRVPCTSASVSYGVGQIPTATITLPPHRLLQRLGREDKIEVALFYLDEHYEVARPEFRLLFEGDIIGWSYSSTPHGRGMQFDCVADIAIFEQLYFYFINTVEALVGYAVPPANNAAGIAQAGVFYPFSLFKKGLITSANSSKNPTPPDITRPFELLYNAVKGMLSVKLPPQQRSLPAVNFFARWARKRNFLNRFVALPDFEDPADQTKGVFPMFKAVQDLNGLDTVQQDIAGSVGNAGTLMDVLRQVFGILYMEIGMLPTPPLVRTDLDGNIIGGPESVPPGAAEKSPLRLVNYFVKPQMLFGVAPECNVFYPSMITAYQYTESYQAQPTRIYLNDGMIPSFVPGTEMTTAALTVGYPPEANAVIQQKFLSTGGVNKTITGKNLLLYPEELYKGPVVARFEPPRWFTLLKIRESALAKAKLIKPGTVHQEFMKMFELYTQYEYYRQRYEKRGGAVDMSWNPYVVPGFPCVVFDARSQAYDTVGYLLNVTQTMSFGQMRTSVNYGFGRTLPEMLDLIVQNFDTYGAVLHSAPLEPLDGVRDIAQKFDRIDSFYKKFFHGDAATSRLGAFDFRTQLGVVKKQKAYAHDAVDPIVLSTSLPDPDLRYLASGPQAPIDPTKLTTNLRSNTPLTYNPSDAYKKAFHSYDEAMHLVARPICTLEQYITFMHAGAPTQQLINDKIIEGANDHYVYDSSGSGETSARFYDRIRRLRQGPGPKPLPSALGVVSSIPAGGTTATATPSPGNYTTLPPNYPQTRDDWDTLLIAYRTEIESKKPLE